MSVGDPSRRFMCAEMTPPLLKDDLASHAVTRCCWWVWTVHTHFEGRRARVVLRHSMPSVLLLAFVAALACALHARPLVAFSVVVPERTGAQCRAEIVSQRSLRTRNGDNPYVAGSSGATGSGDAVILGTPSHVFPAGAVAPLGPTADTLLGIEVRDNGSATPLATPIRGEISLFPRVVAGRDEWHVLLVGSSHHDDGAARPDDQQTIWYVTRTRHGWGTVRRVAQTVGARLRPEYSSGLVRNESGDLAFAYAYETSAGKQGVVLLRNRAGRWTADTLRTSHPVYYVDVAVGRDAKSWIVLTRMPTVQNGRMHYGSLYVSDVDSTWHAPRLVIRARTTSLEEPRLAWLNDRLFVTWSQDPESDGSFAEYSIRWAPVRPDSAIDAADARVVARNANEFTLVNLGRRRVAWLVRDQTNVNRVLLYTAVGDDPQAVNPLGLRNDTGMFGVGRGTFEMLLLSSRLGSKAPEPPVRTLVSVVRLYCDA